MAYNYQDGQVLTGSEVNALTILSAGAPKEVFSSFTAITSATSGAAYVLSNPFVGSIVSGLWYSVNADYIGSTFFESRCITGSPNVGSYIYFPGQTLTINGSAGSVNPFKNGSGSGYYAFGNGGAPGSYVYIFSDDLMQNLTGSFVPINATLTGPQQIGFVWNNEVHILGNNNLAVSGTSVFRHTTVGAALGSYFLGSSANIGAINLKHNPRIFPNGSAGIFQDTIAVGSSGFYFFTPQSTNTVVTIGSSVISKNNFGIASGCYSYDFSPINGLCYCMTNQNSICAILSGTNILTNVAVVGSFNIGNKFNPTSNSAQLWITNNGSCLNVSTGFAIQTGYTLKDTLITAGSLFYTFGLGLNYTSGVRLRFDSYSGLAAVNLRMF